MTILSHVPGIPVSSTDQQIGTPVAGPIRTTVELRAQVRFGPNLGSTVM